MASFWRCWPESGDEDVDQIKLELSDTKDKLREAKKEIARLKFEKITLINKTSIPISTASNSLHRDDIPDINYSHPIPNFEYSDATMIIHPENTATQGSALEKLEEKVMEKFERKTGIKLKYQILAENDSEYDDDDELEQKYKQQVNETNELMKELDRLTIVMQQTENAKNREIDVLKNEILQLNEKQKSGIKTRMKTESFSKSVDRDIADIDSDDSENYEDDLQKETTKKTKQNHYDNTAEQIEILNNEILRNNSLTLLSDELDINGTGEDKGIILFVQKYVKSKTVNQIFTKSPNADSDCIANATGLVNVLSFVTILYKVKVFHVKYGNSGKNKNPKIDNAEIKNAVKYLAIWIVRTYGNKTGDKYFDGNTRKEYDIYNFKLSKHDFQKHMHQYFKEFLQNKAKHIDSHCD